MDLRKIDRAMLRAVWGFFAFIPFCMVWGIESFTLFAFVGTLYFVPVHWIFDRLMRYPSVRCFLGMHEWREISSKGDYPSVRECSVCMKTQKSSYDFWQVEWSDV